MNAAAELPPLPPAVRDRFAAYSELQLRRPEHRGFLIGRLLEEGDGAELRWLAAAVSGDELAGWLVAHGGRALSRRSRAFWATVLAVDVPPPPPLARDLWPLA